MRIFRNGIFNGVVTTFHVLGAAVVFLLMAVIVGDILGRALFGAPVTGAPELVRVSLVSLLFLGMTKTWQAEKHIRATVLVGRLKGRYRLFADFIADFAGLLLFVLLGISGWRLAVESWKIGEFEGAGSLQIQVWPLRFLIVFCSLLTVVYFAASLFRIVRKAIGKHGA